MPFTVSHAAAVLPLRRYLPGLPLSAMVIGSMLPDFGFLIPHMDRNLSHGFGGLFLFACRWAGWCNGSSGVVCRAHCWTLLRARYSVVCKPCWAWSHAACCTSLRHFCWAR